MLIRSAIVLGAFVWGLGLYLDSQRIKHGGLFLALFATSATGYGYAGMAGLAYALAAFTALVAVTGLATISIFRLIAAENGISTPYITRLDWQRFWLYLWH
ncbi:hypothetical protein [Salinisphaera sp. T31B1]|uniref:hypothetical protein n=1 Tax=Salinisphaera sp. T31B1 TaxID=727963 RepID=UPI0033403FEC